MHESINFQKTLEFKIFEKSRQDSITDISIAQSKTQIFEGGDFEEPSEIPQVYIIQGQGQGQPIQGQGQSLNRTISILESTIKDKVNQRVMFQKKQAKFEKKDSNIQKQKVNELGQLGTIKNLNRILRIDDENRGVQNLKNSISGSEALISKNVNLESHKLFQKQRLISRQRNSNQNNKNVDHSSEERLSSSIKSNYQKNMTQQIQKKQKNLYKQNLVPSLSISNVESKKIQEVKRDGSVQSNNQKIFLNQSSILSSEMASRNFRKPNFYRIGGESFSNADNNHLKTQQQITQKHILSQTLGPQRFRNIGAQDLQNIIPNNIFNREKGRESAKNIRNGASSHSRKKNSRKTEGSASDMKGSKGRSVSNFAATNFQNQCLSSSGNISKIDKLIRKNIKKQKELENKKLIEIQLKQVQEQEKKQQIHLQNEIVRQIHKQKFQKSSERAQISQEKPLKISKSNQKQNAINKERIKMQSQMHIQSKPPLSRIGGMSISNQSINNLRNINSKSNLNVKTINQNTNNSIKQHNLHQQNQTEKPFFQDELSLQIEYQNQNDSKLNNNKNIKPNKGLNNNAFKIRAQNQEDSEHLQNLEYQMNNISYQQNNDSDIMKHFQNQYLNNNMQSYEDPDVVYNKQDQSIFENSKLQILKNNQKNSIQNEYQNKPKQITKDSEIINAKTDTLISQKEDFKQFSEIQGKMIQGQQMSGKAIKRKGNSKLNAQKTFNATSVLVGQENLSATNQIGMDFLYIKKDIIDELKQIDKKVKEKFEFNQRRKNHQSSLKDINLLVQQNQMETMLGLKNSMRNNDSSEEKLVRTHKSKDKNLQKRDSSIQEQRLDKFITKISNKIQKQLIGQIRAEATIESDINCSKTLAKLRSQSTSPVMKKKNINQSDGDLRKKDNKIYSNKPNNQKSIPNLMQKSHLQSSVLRIYKENGQKQTQNKSQRPYVKKNNYISKSKSPPSQNIQAVFSRFNDSKLQKSQNQFKILKNYTQEDNQNDFKNFQESQNKINLQNHFVKQDDLIDHSQKNQKQLGIQSVNTLHSQQLKNQIKQFIKQKNKMKQENIKNERIHQLLQMKKVHDNLSKLEEYVKNNNQQFQVSQISPETDVNIHFEFDKFKNNDCQILWQNVQKSSRQRNESQGQKKSVNQGNRRKSTDRKLNQCSSSQKIGIARSKSRDRRKTLGTSQQIRPKSPNLPNSKMAKILKNNVDPEIQNQIESQISHKIQAKSRNNKLRANNTSSNVQLEKFSGTKTLKNIQSAIQKQVNKKQKGAPQLFLNVNTEDNISRISFYNPQRQQSANYQFQQQTPQKVLFDDTRKYKQIKAVNSQNIQKRLKETLNYQNKSADQNKNKQIDYQQFEKEKIISSNQFSQTMYRNNDRKLKKTGTNLNIKNIKSQNKTNEFIEKKKDQKRSPEEFSSPFEKQKKKSKSLSKSQSKSKQSGKKSATKSNSKQSQSHSRSKRNYFGPFIQSQPDFKEKIEEELKNIEKKKVKKSTVVNLQKQNLPQNIQKKQSEIKGLNLSNLKFNNLKLKIDHDQLNEILRKINIDSINLKKKINKSNDQKQQVQIYNEDLIQQKQEDLDSQIVLDAQQKRKMIQAKNISINTMNLINQKSEKSNDSHKAKEKRNPVREIAQLKDDKFKPLIIGSSQHTELSNQPYTMVESHRSINSQKIPIISSAKRKKAGPYASTSIQEPLEDKIYILQAEKNGSNIHINVIQKQESQKSSSIVRSIEVHAVELQKNSDDRLAQSSSPNISSQQQDPQLSNDIPNNNMLSNIYKQMLIDKTEKRPGILVNDKYQKVHYDEKLKNQILNNSQIVIDSEIGQLQINSEILQNKRSLGELQIKQQKHDQKSSQNPFLNELIQRKKVDSFKNPSKNSMKKNEKLDKKNIIQSLRSIISPESKNGNQSQQQLSDKSMNLHSDSQQSKILNNERNQETIVNENNDFSIELQTFQKLELEPADNASIAGGPVTLISHLNANSYNSQSDVRNNASFHYQDDLDSSRIKDSFDAQKDDNHMQDTRKTKGAQKQISADLFQRESRGVGLIKYLNEQINFEKLQKQFQTQANNQVQKIGGAGKEISNDNLNELKYSESVNYLNQDHQDSKDQEKIQNIEKIISESSSLQSQQNEISGQYFLDHNNIDLILNEKEMQQIEGQQQVKDDNQSQEDEQQHLLIQKKEEEIKNQLQSLIQEEGQQTAQELNKYLDSDIGSEFSLSPTGNANDKNIESKMINDNQNSLHQIELVKDQIQQQSPSTSVKLKTEKDYNIFQPFNQEDKKNMLNPTNWTQTNSFSQLPEQQNQIFSFSLTDTAVKEIGQQALQAQKSLPEMNINSELSTLNIDAENSSSDAGNPNRQRQFPYIDNLNQIINKNQSNESEQKNLIIQDEENSEDTNEQEQISRNNDLKFINKFRKRQKEARQKHYKDQNQLDQSANQSAENSLKVIGDQIHQNRVAIVLGIEINQIEIDIQENRSDEQDSSSGQFDLNQFTQKVNQAVSEDQHLKSLNNQKSGSYGNELVEDKLFSIMDNLNDDDSQKSDSKNDEFVIESSNQEILKKQIIFDKLEQNNQDLEDTSDNQSNNEIDFLPSNSTIKISDIVHKKPSGSQSVQIEQQVDESKSQQIDESNNNEIGLKLQSNDNQAQKTGNNEDHQQHLFIEKRPADKNKDNKNLVIEENKSNESNKKSDKKQNDYQPILAEKVQEYLKSSINQQELSHQIKQVIEMKQRQNIENDLMRTDDYVNELLQYLIQFEVLQGDDDQEALLQEFNGGVNYLTIFLNNLTQPIKREPLDELKRLQTQDLGSYSHFETCIDPLKFPILSIDMYLDVEKQRQFAYQMNQKEDTKKDSFYQKQYNSANSAFSALSGLSASIGQESLHILNKSIFDAMNESLTKFRPYGIIGEPLPWSKKYRRLQNEVDINSVDTERLFQMVKQEVYRWMSAQQGTLSYKQESVFQYIDLHIPLMPEIQDRIRIQAPGKEGEQALQELTNLQKLQLQTPKELENLQDSQISKYKNKLIEDATQEMRQAKLSNLLHQEIVEDEHNWLNYEFEESQIRIDLSEIILESLVQEVVEFLNQKHKPIAQI